MPWADSLCLCYFRQQAVPAPHHLSAAACSFPFSVTFPILPCIQETSASQLSFPVVCFFLSDAIFATVGPAMDPWAMLMTLEQVYVLLSFEISSVYVPGIHPHPDMLEPSLRVKSTTLGIKVG